MYLRPTAIATTPFLGVAPSTEVKVFVIMSPVGPYYDEGFKPIKLYADAENVRAWPGGVGNAKLGGNYGPTIAPQMAAAKHGCAQILWLWENQGEHYATEVSFLSFPLPLIPPSHPSLSSRLIGRVHEHLLRRRPGGRRGPRASNSSSGPG